MEDCKSSSCITKNEAAIRNRQKYGILFGIAFNLLENREEAKWLTIPIKERGTPFLRETEVVRGLPWEDCQESFHQQVA